MSFGIYLYCILYIFQNFYRIPYSIRSIKLAPEILYWYFFLVGKKLPKQIPNKFQPNVSKEIATKIPKGIPKK